MKNIRIDEDYEEIRKRIMALSITSPRQWGKMDVQQMLVHCTTQLKLALGEIPSSTQGPFLMRTGLVKWIVLSHLPWPKGASTPTQMDVIKNEIKLKGIELEKMDLLKYIEKAKNQEQFKPHPFFGKLSNEEWYRLIYKHLDHHLKQFISL